MSGDDDDDDHDDDADDGDGNDSEGSFTEVLSLPYIGWSNRGAPRARLLRLSPRVSAYVSTVRARASIGADGAPPEPAAAILVLATLWLVL